jgi:hypothetical protein
VCVRAASLPRHPSAVSAAHRVEPAVLVKALVGVGPKEVALGLGGVQHCTKRTSTQAELYGGTTWQLDCCCWWALLKHGCQQIVRFNTARHTRGSTSVRITHLHQVGGQALPAVRVKVGEGGGEAGGGDAVVDSQAHLEPAASTILSGSDSCKYVQALAGSLYSCPSSAGLK